MALTTEQKMGGAIRSLETGMEAALAAVQKLSPLPFDGTTNGQEDIANAIVQAAHLQAATALVIKARDYVA